LTNVEQLVNDIKARFNALPGGFPARLINKLTAGPKRSSSSSHQN